jgi:hypothetical protein
VPTIADLHWRLLHAIPRRVLSLFVVRGVLEGPFPPDLIERIRDGMNHGRFLWSRCLPIAESEWLQKRFAHPNAALFRASAQRERSELCVHAVDADFGSLKVVWIGMSNDATLVLYEVFFPSLAALVTIGSIVAVVNLFFTPWALALFVLLATITYWSLSKTRSELERVIEALRRLSFVHPSRT